MVWKTTPAPRTVDEVIVEPAIDQRVQASTHPTVRRWVRIALGYLILVTAQVGVWALVAPRSFYDDFPGLGRAWVSIDGPYNEHLVRDVGALNLALVVLFAAAWWLLDRRLTRLAGVAALVWGVPHAAYHLANTGGFDAADLAASLSGLILFAVIGGGLLWSAPRLDRVAP